jgi:hypothetical protein
MGTINMENLLNKEYKLLVHNQDKFLYLEKLFSKNKFLSIQDFELIISDNDEIVYFFIDEYDFLELKNERKKFDFMVKFLQEKINYVDDYIFSDLLDFAKKIEFWDIIKEIKLIDKSIIRKTIVLNFIENGVSEIDVDFLEYYLKNMLKVKIDSLNKFIVLFNLSKIDKYYLKSVEELRNLGELKIQRRIETKKEYYQMLS